MESRFDDFSRELARSASRREALRTLGGLLISSAAALVGLRGRA